MSDTRATDVKAKPPCPYCGHQNGRVVDVWYRRDGAVRRRRQCDDCGWRYSTTERADEAYIPTGGEDLRFGRA